MSKTDHTPHEAPWNEPLDERERELMDPDYWDESTTEVYGPSPRRGIRLVLHLEGEDLRAISAAAQTADVPLSRYILQAALKAAKRPRKVPPGHHRSEGAA
jgi:hypothetical protein